jgi:hypothetical protein
MMTATQCRGYATDCRDRGMAAGISTRRATALLAMSRSWSVLANQVERYDAILKEEGA